MRCLLLIMTLAALSTSFEAAQEFHQMEKGVHVLGPEVAEESEIVVQPEASKRPIIVVRPDEGESWPIIVVRPDDGESWPIIVVRPDDGESWPIIIVRPDIDERPIGIVRPQADGDSVVTLMQAQREEANGVTRSNNISMGTIGFRDFLLAHYTPRVQAVANQVVIQDINFRGIALIRISFIRAIQTAGQLATARIIAGGLGMNFVTIRLTSARGSGFQYSIDIWGH